MKNWKQALDSYLTTPPDDGFDCWCEAVDNLFSDEFWEQHGEGWLALPDGLYTKWMNKLFKIGKEPEEAAKIMERAYKIFILPTEQSDT